MEVYNMNVDTKDVDFAKDFTKTSRGLRQGGGQVDRLPHGGAQLRL